MELLFTYLLNILSDLLYVPGIMSGAKDNFKELTVLCRRHSVAEVHNGEMSGATSLFSWALSTFALAAPSSIKNIKIIFYYYD